MLLLQERIAPPPPPPQKKNMTLCVIGRVKFERNCGKIYSRHLFTYGGLISTQIGRWSSLLVERVRAKKGRLGRASSLSPVTPFSLVLFFARPPIIKSREQAMSRWSPGVYGWHDLTPQYKS